MKAPDIKHLSTDELLDVLGLQRRGEHEWLWPSLGLFAAGILLGAGVGLLFAPKRALKLGEKLEKGRERIEEAASRLI
jgi:hypothetical protein